MVQRQHRKWLFSLIVLTTLVAGLATGLWYYFNPPSIDNRIVLFDASRDFEAATALMEDEWNWLQDTPRSQYSLEDLFMKGIPAPWEPHRVGQLKTYVLHKDDDLVGFVSLYKLSEYLGRVLFLAVDKKYRRQGYATRLLIFALKKLKEMGAKTGRLLTRKVNAQARALYEKIGFKEVFDVEGFVYYHIDLKDF